MNRKRSICLFCGSRMGNQDSFRSAAEEFGAGVGGNGWRLVYGGGGIGLMGIAARAAKAAGGSVFGVIPKHLLGIEAARFDLDALVVTENMHERKAVMIANSDAFAALPGGPGTLDEFFEVLTWRQLGLHEKPIHLLNCGGYWDHLLALTENLAAEGFAGRSLRSYFSVADSVPELIEGLRSDLP